MNTLVDLNVKANVNANANANAKAAVTWALLMCVGGTGEAASFMRDLLQRDLLHLNSNWPLFGLI